jgi:DNA-binding CsgD family transcriptional regulator
VVGRELELDAAKRFLDSVEAGSAALVLGGEPGIGKTTVWRAACELADDRGYRVLACRPAQAEAKLSYAGLTDLLVDCGDAYARIPDPQREALGIALLQSAPGTTPPDPRVVYAAFSSTLHVLASEYTLLVAVDDLQWLDRPSAAALVFALRRAGGARIGFLLARRTEEDELLPAALARALQDAGAERIELGALTVGALHTIIADAVGRPPPRPVLLRLADVSRGNPFYALEIARELERHGELSAGEALPIPADLSELVASRIARLSPVTQDALLTAAALASPRQEQLDREAIAAAEDAGLVRLRGDRVTFSHPLFASAVYASAAPERRRQVHRLLADEVTEPEERARHLALATTGADEAIAAELDAAAVQARARGSPEAAAELMELAVRLTPPDDEAARDERVLAAAEHAFHAGDLARSRALAEDVLSGSTDGHRRGHALRILGEARYHESSFGEAVPLFEEALSLLADDPRVVDLHVNLAYAYVNLGDMQAAQPHAVAAVEHAERAGDDGLTAVALAVFVIVRFYAGERLDRATLDRALGLEDPGRQVVMPMRPSLIAGIVLHITDELERSEELFTALREQTRERGEDSDVPLLATQIGMLLRDRGRAAEALEHLADGFDVAQVVGSDTGLVLVLAERCGARGLLGDEAGARADADEARRLAIESEYWFGNMWASWCLATLELSLANHAAASAAMAPVASIVLGRGTCDPISATFLPEAIEALVGTGELDQAEALADVFDTYAGFQAYRSAISSAARCRGLVLAAHGDVPGALEQANRALEQAVPELPVQVGRALLLLGRLERRARRKRPAREALEQAAAIFESIGASIWAARAAAELDRTGLRHTTSDDLTPTEQRIAELAAQGLTNKQIAEAAFLSPKTVEANLARAYRKLGIHRRAELGQALAGREMLAK